LLDGAELAERLGHRGMALGVADLLEDLLRLLEDFFAGVLPVGIEIGSDHLVDTGGGLALHFELGQRAARRGIRRAVARDRRS
jgi:hypothetical protein